MPGIQPTAPDFQADQASEAPVLVRALYLVVSVALKGGLSVACYSLGLPLGFLGQVSLVFPSQVLAMVEGTTQTYFAEM